MKTNYFKTAIILLMITLMGCNDEVEVTPINERSSTNINEVKYVYKGQTSIIKYKYEGDSAILLEGKDNARIKAAYDLPTLATYVDLSDTSTVYLFDTEIEFNAHFEKDNNIIKNDSNTKGGTVDIGNDKMSNSYGPPYYPEIPYDYPANSVYVFEHSNQGGQYYALVYNTTTYTYYDTVNLPDLVYTVDGNWSDRITSLYMDMSNASNNGVVLQLYEHTKYGGKTITFSCNPGVKGLRVNNLKDVPMGGLFGGNWNDEASSLKVFYYTK